uniref:Interleukin-1 receptor accessory protein n=1 Tax=Dicentrarchus labrax TaxID=13489 RepID=A0A8P4K7Z3_DICLA
MASFTSTLLFLATVLVGITPAVSQPDDPSGLTCNDWGESIEGSVSIVEGELGWLSCPLFSHPSVYNYTSTQSSGQNLFWYRVPEGQDLEQPIASSSRLARDRERLWLLPAAANDTGQYICMLRNRSSCTKIAMRLKVLRPDEVVRGNDCEPPVTVAASPVIIPLQGGKLVDCPDLQDAAAVGLLKSRATVTWMHIIPNSSIYHIMSQPRCRPPESWTNDREVKGVRLQVHVMMVTYQGLYICTVRYQRGGTMLSYSRSINVTAVNPPSMHKEPTILVPTREKVFTVKQDTEVQLLCKALFPYLDSSQWAMWWMVDGKTLDKVHDHHRFSKTTRKVKDDFGDRTEESVLVIQDFQAEDLKREFNCSVKNERGFETRRVQLVEEDDKEYDVYISYARNSEEEQFVLSTLRSVLENELGYSVCIFDRDSLPGGTITDETLSFVARSRRLLVVVSPGYASHGSQALLELKAGIDGMALGGHLRVILIQYKPVRRQGWVRELRRARVALALVRWQGDKSKELTSRFWKRLRVELPVRRVSGGEEGGKDVALMRLHSQNSTNSQTGLISDTVKHPHKVFNSAG